MAQYPFILFTALLLLAGAHALLNTVLAQETPVGLMAPMGVSPLPTDPPELPESIPKELVPRVATLPYPPPGYYCGLVNGDPCLSSSLFDN